MISKNELERIRDKLREANAALETVQDVLADNTARVYYTTDFKNADGSTGFAVVKASSMGEARLRLGVAIEDADEDNYVRTGFTVCELVSGVLVLDS